MTNNLSYLKDDITCVAIKKTGIFVSKDKGIKPIISWLLENENFLNSSVVVDTVVGKAAAMLFVFGKVKEVETPLISKPALDFLNENKIPVYYTNSVPFIENRNKTGMCPMEKAVLHVHDSSEAFFILCKKCKEMGIIDWHIYNSVL